MCFMHSQFSYENISQRNFATLLPHQYSFQFQPLSVIGPGFGGQQNGEGIYRKVTHIISVFFGIHILKLERYREDQHGPCARMTRKFVKRSKFCFYFSRVISDNLDNTRQLTHCYIIRLELVNPEPLVVESCVTSQNVHKGRFKGTNFNI